MPNEPAAVDRAAELIRSIGIPPCPRILTDIAREARAAEPDFHRIGGLITKDVGLAASLLKTVNSPYYSLPVKATSVQQALQLMGLRNVTQLVTGLLLRRAFPVGGSASLDGFWEVSNRIALATSFLAAGMRGMHRDEVYTFGLFRDCGFPIMLQAFPGYAGVYQAADIDPSRSPAETERDAIGVDHAEIGAMLAAGWLLPRHVCVAIRHHHDLDAVLHRSDVPVESARMIALALVAEYAYRNLDEPDAFADWIRLGNAALDCCGIESVRLPEIVEDVRNLLQSD